MGCYQCGSDSGTETRLCPDCNVSRMEGRRQINASVLPRRNASDLSRFYPLFLCGGLAVIVLMAAAFFVVGGPVLTKDTGGHFVVSDSDREMRFAYQESARVTGHVYYTVPVDASVRHAGVFMQFHYLNDSSYAEFKRKYNSSARCPASFFNQNMKHIFLQSNSESCINIIKGRKYKEWDSFQIEGRYARFDGGENKKGQKVTFPGGDYRFFVVDSCY